LTALAETAEEAVEVVQKARAALKQKS